MHIHRIVTRARSAPAYAPGPADLLQCLAGGLPELVFGERLTFTPGESTIAHSHDDLHQLNFFPGGSGIYRSEGPDLLIRATTVLLTPPRRIHELVSSDSDPLSGFTLRFRLPGETLAPPAAAIDLPPAAGQRLEALLSEALAHHADRLLAGLRLCEALALVLRQGTPAALQPRGASLAGRAVDHLELHFREPLTMPAIARALGVTQFHLCRVFKQELATSPMATLRKIRLGYATERLFRSNEPLADIAHQAGFATVTNLRRAFVAEHGQTPQEFRAQRKEF